MAGSILSHSDGSVNAKVGMAEGEGIGVGEDRGLAVRVVTDVEVGFAIPVAEGVLVRVEGKTVVGAAVSNLAEEHAAITRVKASKRIRYWRMNHTLDDITVAASLQLQPHHLFVKIFVADLNRLGFATVHREAKRLIQALGRGLGDDDAEQELLQVGQPGGAANRFR